MTQVTMLPFGSPLPQAPAPVTDTHRAFDDAVAALVDFAFAYRDDVAYRTAVAGNGMGSLDVPGTQRRIYVELGAAGGDVAEAQYDMFKPALQDVILLTRPRMLGLSGWLVLGWVAGDELPCFVEEEA